MLQNPDCVCSVCADPSIRLRAAKGCQAEPDEPEVVHSLSACQPKEPAVFQCECGRHIVWTGSCLRYTSESDRKGQAPDAALTTVQPVPYEKEPDPVLGLGEPEPVLPSLVWDWDEPESGAAGLQYPCGQTNDAWLGLLVSVVDVVADEYVFEACGGDDRPKLMCTLDMIHDIDSFNGLTPASQAKWQNILKVWQEAGWNWDRLSGLADELRPLQYDSGIRFEHAQHVTAQQLSQCATEFCRAAGWSKGMQEELQDFVRVVQQNFSDPASILVPKNVQQVLHDVP